MQQHSSLCLKPVSRFCEQNVAGSQALLDASVIPVSVYGTSDKSAAGCKCFECQWTYAIRCTQHHSVSSSEELHIMCIAPMSLLRSVHVCRACQWQQWGRQSRKVRVHQPVSSCLILRASKRPDTEGGKLQLNPVVLQQCLLLMVTHSAVNTAAAWKPMTVIARHMQCSFVLHSLSAVRPVLALNWRHVHTKPASAYFVADTVAGGKAGNVSARADVALPLTSSSGS